MKEFACGDVVPDCNARFRGTDDDEILVAVAEHARSAHGMAEVPEQLAAQVRLRTTSTLS